MRRVWTGSWTGGGDMRVALSTVAVAALLHGLSNQAPAVLSDSCEGLDPYGRLEECDRTIGDQPATNCVLRGWCPVEQPEIGLGYQECRRQDIPPANPGATPDPLCSALPGEWEDCNGDCVPRGRKCSCRTEHCDAVTSCRELGPEFEACRGACVPRGDCGACGGLGAGMFESCRGACVPYGDCVPDGVHEGGLACTRCESCPLEVRLTLDIDYSLVACSGGDLCGSNFTRVLVADLEQVTKVRASRFKIMDLQPGSVVVTLQILRDTDPSAVTPAEALVTLQAALELSAANDANHAICDAVDLGVEASCTGTADDSLLYPRCDVAMAAAVYNHREDCPAGCTYAGTEAACEDAGVCLYTEEERYQSGNIKTPESCISETFHSRVTLGTAAVLDLEVTAVDPDAAPPAVPCPANSRGAGDGAPCACRPGFIGTVRWDEDTGTYTSQDPFLYQICDEIVPCARPNDWNGMFDTRDCAATPSGETCPMHCAPGTKGRSTTFQCPVNNVDPYLPSAGPYPNDCQAAPMPADPAEVAKLVQIKMQIDSPPSIRVWVQGGDPCIYFWPGVGCDYLTGEVIRLSLRRQKLTGIIPNTIGRGLRNLEILELDDNRFSGAIPFELGFFLRDLEKLDLSKNILTGTIHTYFEKLTLLKKLILHSNQISGTLPRSLSALTELERIDLHDNQFEGDLSMFVDESASLTHVDVSKNQLTGMDHYWHNHTNLRELNLGYNQITGTIPIGLATGCPLLQKLTLQSNQLSGTIPVEFGNLIYLTELRLSNNFFNGTILDEFHVFSSIRVLDLGNNRDISGTLPPELGSLTQLQRLHLHDLQLTGTVPSELASLSGTLERLYLRENAITGTLPSGTGLKAGEAGGCTPPYGKDEMAVCEAGDVLFGWIDCSVRGASQCGESDGCRDDPCFKSEDGLIELQCNDVPSPGAGYVCDPCPSGYAGNGIECFDIDDCIVYDQDCLDAGIDGVDCAIPGTNPCDVFDPDDPSGSTKLVHGICTDTGPNSYTCDCAPDAKVCADVQLNRRSSTCYNAGDCVYTAYVEAVEYVAPVVGVEESCVEYQWNDGDAIDACRAVTLDGTEATCLSAIDGCAAPGCTPRCVYTAAVEEVLEVDEVIGVEEKCEARQDNPPAFRFSPGTGTCEMVMPCDVVELNDCDELAICRHLGPGQHGCECQPPGAYEGDGTAGNCLDRDACDPNPCFDGPHPFNDDVACHDIVAECKHDDDARIAAIMAFHEVDGVTTCARVVELAAGAMARGDPRALQCTDSFFREGPLEKICPVSCGLCTSEEADIILAGQGYRCDPCPSGYAGDGETCEDIDDCIDANGYNPCDVRNPADPGGAVLVSGTCEDQGPNLYSCLYQTGSGR